MPPPVPPPFSITTAQINGAAYVTVRGALDVATADQLHDALAEQGAHGGMLVLDMTGLEFIDSTGIKVLFVAWQESQRDGFSLRLTHGSDQVMNALKLVGLIDELPFLGRY